MFYPEALSMKCIRRHFSTTICRRTHYETLGVPEGASKSQIKSHFYKLSKLHHPDVSKDPTSRAVFQKASEAYNVLSNDRERRAYDRSLLHRAPPRHNYAYHPRAPPSRTPRATHAWESPSRGAAPKPPPDYAHTPPSARSRSPPFTAPGPGQPFAGPSHIDILTGSRKRAEDKERELDKIRHQLIIIRPLQVLGALLAGVGVLYGVLR